MGKREATQRAWKLNMKEKRRKRENNVKVVIEKMAVSMEKLKLKEDKTRAGIKKSWNMKMKLGVQEMKEIA